MGCALRTLTWDASSPGEGRCVRLVRTARL